MVLGVIMRIVGHLQCAEDLVQETFKSAWQKIGAFRGDAEFKTWIYRIATNEALSYLRWLKRRREVSLDDQGSDDGDEESGVHSGDEYSSYRARGYELDYQRERERAWLAVVQDMTPLEKKVMRLLFVEGHKPQKVRELLVDDEVTITTIYSISARIRRKCLKALSEQAEAAKLLTR
jgi:RNA polymerase sigma-70 factor (ECF subfamily)